MTVNYSIVGGDGASGILYAALSGSVTIPAGQTSATITVTPLVSGNEPEVVGLALAGPGAYTVSAGGGTAWVVIADDWALAGGMWMTYRW